MTLDKARRQRLIEQIIQKLDTGSAVDDALLRKAIVEEISRQFERSQLSLRERQDLAERLFASMRGFDVLQPLIEDNTVTEIMVNCPDRIFFEKHGKLQRSDICFDDQQHLENFICRYFGQANRLINEQNTMSDMRLPDGSRVHAVLGPTAIAGPVLTIRRFTGIRPQMPALIEAGFLTAAAASYLQEAVEGRKNIFISGGTGSGKTTFLNALSGCIPSNQRVVTIEDAAELDLQGLPNLVRLEARLPGPDGKGGIALSDLIRASLRMRPDRIIVGEVRGCEAYDMLQAMQTGHPGSMSTGHGNSCADMLDRLALMILMGSGLPWDACRRMVAGAIDILIQIERDSTGHRHIMDIEETCGIDKDRFCLRPAPTEIQAERIQYCGNLPGGRVIF